MSCCFTRVHYTDEGRPHTSFQQSFCGGTSVSDTMAALQVLKDRLRALQRDLERLYALEAGPDVASFVRLDETHEHETLLVRQSSEAELELALVFPASIDPQAAPASNDHLELLEGVSHFVYIAERARTQLPTTQLELELQAEVDKFALLSERIAPPALSHLHQKLFERVRYLHAEDTPRGQRYRLANRLAARFWSRLMTLADPTSQCESLRRFYRAGQADKIRLVAAA